MIFVISDCLLEQKDIIIIVCFQFCNKVVLQHSSPKPKACDYQTEIQLKS